MKQYVRMILTGFLVCTSCGLFTPREIRNEPVDPSEKVVDPFGFNMLLNGTGETFERYSWQDYFLDKFEYVNVHSAGTVYGRDRVINRLLQLLEIDTSISVAWSKPDETSRDEKTIILRSVAYAVTLSERPDSVLFSGTCDFEIVKESTTLQWRLKYWKDFSQLQFFSPGN